MAKAIGVAETKRTFSELVGQVLFAGHRFVIERKGKPVVAMVSVEDLRKLEGSTEKEKPRGLLAAVGAWEDSPNLDKVISEIYRTRRRAKDRRVKR